MLFLKPDSKYQSQTLLHLQINPLVLQVLLLILKKFLNETETNKPDSALKPSGSPSTPRTSSPVTPSSPALPPRARGTSTLDGHSSIPVEQSTTQTSPSLVFTRLDDSKRPKPPPPQNQGPVIAAVAPTKQRSATAIGTNPNSPALPSRTNINPVESNQPHDDRRNRGLSQPQTASPRVTKPPPPKPETQQTESSGKHSTPHPVEQHTKTPPQQTETHPKQSKQSDNTKSNTQQGEQPASPKVQGTPTKIPGIVLIAPSTKTPTKKAAKSEKKVERTAKPPPKVRVESKSASENDTISENAQTDAHTETDMETKPALNPSDTTNPPSQTFTQEVKKDSDKKISITKPAVLLLHPKAKEDKSSTSKPKQPNLQQSEEQTKTHLTQQKTPATGHSSSTTPGRNAQASQKPTQNSAPTSKEQHSTDTDSVSQPVSQEVFPIQETKNAPPSIPAKQQSTPNFVTSPDTFEKPPARMSRPVPATPSRKKRASYRQSISLWMIVFTTDFVRICKTRSYSRRNRRATNESLPHVGFR